MADFDTGNAATRDDLVQRVALMETMIAEGRRTTERSGWIFLMWGLVYFAAMGWVFFLPFPSFAWPVCITAGIVILRAAKLRQRRKGAPATQRSRSIEAVWKGMGLAVTLYILAAIVSHHYKEPSYFAAILFFVGLAHAVSAAILRWGMQGVVAAIWWVGGIAIFFSSRPSKSIAIFLAATFFGQIVFGLYVMMLDRQRTASVQHHA